MNTFYHGDCLFVLQHDILPESIDLIYLDPPFFTGKVQKARARSLALPRGYVQDFSWSNLGFLSGWDAFPSI